MIFAHPPIVVHNGSSVCVCFRKGKKTVSLALDDSCGSREVLSRGTIDLFVEGERDPVTPVVFSDLAHEEDEECEFLVVPSTVENFMRAMRWAHYDFDGWAKDAERYLGIERANRPQ